ncbi:MAG: RHS domain-containing protein, partial [Candidatus Thiodiazotropha sp. (ex Epidulcina cf. delphinae)]|nr:RHS domain-containing protein [Candidatus Thiodiazotropha sp. (ex Epidulcina cf. delphinae)]
GCTNAAGTGCTGAAQITTYRYDAANRLIEEATPSGTTTLDYDPATGRLAQLTDDNSHEAFVYDAQGRLTRHTRHLDGHRFATGYVYNQEGKLQQKQLPDGQTLTYHYYLEGNQKGRLRAITRPGLFGLKKIPLIGEIDQDAGDGETGLTFGNGLRETRQHDPFGRVTAIDHSRQLKLQYQYDEQGRISGIDLDGLLQSYDYDPLGRLTQAETQLGSYRYDYDSLGNRTRKAHTDKAGNTATQENTYPDLGEGNRLLSQGNGNSQEYTYNPSGSPERIGERRYEYNDQQRPVRLYRVDPDDTQQQTLVAEYAYNRFGERIKKVVYSNSKRPKVTYYLYDGHQLTAEADDEGEITAQYLYQNERPVLKLEGKTPYAIHTDHLGAPRAVTDKDQEQVWSADYSPFGLIQIEKQQISLNLRLPGQYEDQESGTYYNYQRDYDPQSGRYLTSDPIGLMGGLNTYAYVGGNPLGAIDPLGLYRLVMGFEVNHPDAFVDNIHDLNVDYGHAFFYLVNPYGEISDVLSFGPAERMTRKGQILGVDGTTNYQITEDVKLFSIDLNLAQYLYIKTRISYMQINTPDYWTALNDTCAETALDLVDDWIISLGLPSGSSRVRVPMHLQSYSDAAGLTEEGVTDFSIVNPYALHSQMLESGHIQYEMDSSSFTTSGYLVEGDIDPLINEGYIEPEPIPEIEAPIDGP